MAIHNYVYHIKSLNEIKTTRRKKYVIKIERKIQVIGRDVDVFINKVSSNLTKSRVLKGRRTRHKPQFEIYTDKGRVRTPISLSSKEHKFLKVVTSNWKNPYNIYLTGRKSKRLRNI